MSVDVPRPTTLRVMHEWSVEFPVWDRSPDAYGPVDPESLHLPPALVAGLRAWAAELEGRPGGIEQFAWADAAEEADWLARGRTLTHELFHALGGEVDVQYAPQGEELFRL